MNNHLSQIDVRILNQGLSNPYENSIPILTNQNLECGHVEWSLFSNSKEQANRHPEIVDLIRSRPIWPLALIESLEVYVKYRERGYGRKGLRSAIDAAENAGAAFAFLRVSWDVTKEDPDAERAWKIRFFQSEGFELADRNDDEPFLMFRSLRMNPVNTHES
jgi:ribosomal protein S18 acetylase RimI-like enzyme